MSIQDWQGKVALVTGASGGIGEAVAQALMEAGLNVVVCARRIERLRTLVAGHDNALAIEADLRRTGDIDAMFTQIRSKWGGVDVLVNNAGLGHNAPLMSGEVEEWREMLEVNVLALMICTREAIRDMQRSNTAGHIIHISSMSAYRVTSGSGLYSATKFAVRSLTEGLRMELREAGSDVRVTAISPGFVETEFAEKFHGSKQAADKTYSRFPCLTSDDIANAVLYVLGQPKHVQFHDLLLRPTRQIS